eukprot:12531561-Alexandrium_andersonii.AAC.1
MIEGHPRSHRLTSTPNASEFHHDTKPGLALALANALGFMGIRELGAAKSLHADFQTLLELALIEQGE